MIIHVEHITPIVKLKASLRQSLATKIALKIMKNAFSFTLKALLVHKIIRFLSWIFGDIEK